MECYCDEELLYLMRCGNEVAQRCLYERYQQYLKRWASKYIGQLNSVFGWEDLLQEGMYILGNVFDTFRDDRDTSLKTYANIVTSRRLLTYVSKQCIKKTLHDTEVISLDQPSHNEDGLRYDEIIKNPKENYCPLSYMSIKETGVQYKKILEDSLSLRERKVMSYIQKGYSQEEVSQKLELPLKSVYNTIYRYHQKMKDID